MHDPLWMRIFLGVHISAGFTSFVLAPVAMLTAKGGKAHRLWGKVYFWAMAVVAATALPMALYRPVLFLALVAVFSFYASFAAYRVLYLKDLPRGGKAKPADWIAGGVTMLASSALLLCGLLRPALVQNVGVIVVAGARVAIVPVVFGLIGLRLAMATLSKFVNPPTEKMFWWYGHLQGMIGSYIAAWSAFSVVTLSRYLGNEWYVWLWPTMIGVPGMIVWTAYYKRKFAKRNRTAATAAITGSSAATG